MPTGLDAIGFDAWCRDQADPVRLAAGEIARVIAAAVGSPGPPGRS